MKNEKNTLTLNFNKEWWDTKIPVLLNQCVAKLENVDFVVLLDDDLKIGACVVQAEPEYFISLVRRGTVIGILHLSVILANNSDFISDLYPFKCAMIPENEFYEKKRFCDYDLGAEYPDVTIRIVKERADVWGYIFTQALRFFVLHECGHAYRNHLAIKEILSDRESWDEVDSNLYAKLSENQKLTRRAFEIDADLFAIFQIIQSTTKYKRKDEFELTICGVIVAFAILSQNENQLIRDSDRKSVDFQLKNRLHPSMGLRLMMLIEILSRFLRLEEIDGEVERFDFFLKNCKFILDEVGISESLSWALYTRLDKISVDHPYQEERFSVIQRLRDMEPVISRFYKSRFSSN